MILGLLTPDAAPLFDDTGKIAFFFGAQIDCSNAIHTWSDLLRILSASDNEMSFTSSKELVSSNIIEGVDKSTRAPGMWSWSRFRAGASSLESRRNRQIDFDLKEVGEEERVTNEMQWKDFEAQVETYYTSYSKVLLLPLP
jgi:hypothetical protein